ncbi:MAG: Uma2 family endonuclease [Gammaproteobacteria bacterium]|nr:Uma2 family endonuclease [Gammaproteobacteria bacterium]MBU1653516.1 Uma2 family endonuclease [Gammaproteobacteria bacterium]MBU1961864.1 Uma2 family endonuclease [Gammaproteobacteria bacterium]
MALPAFKPATYQDLFDLPENLVGEIIAGRLVTHPRPAPRQARAYSAIGSQLWNPYDRGHEGPGGWWRERMPRLPETAWFDLAPDWVCEILSPATARVDRVEKLPIYARQGVGHAWLVDPDLRTLEVFENRDGKWLLLTVLENDALVSQPPFVATSFSLSGLWAN